MPGQATKSRSEENQSEQPSQEIVMRVQRVLEDVMDVSVVDLERAVQEAHECHIRQVEEPAERFAVSRQALRMFWHFRCNLEAVMESRQG